MATAASCRTIAALLLSLALAPVRAAPTLQPCEGDAAETAAAQWLEAINAVRRSDAPCAAAAARVKLQLQPQLTASAAELAGDLAQRRLLSHQDARQRPLTERLSAGGYAFGRAGETLATGRQAFADVLLDWLASPAHCAVLMTAEFSEVGLACARSADGEGEGDGGERYWVAQFATPRRR